MENRNLKQLPLEIINEIVDYNNYEKYCKPEHQNNFKEVLRNITDMSEIMKVITPTLVWQCWGPGTKFFNDWIYEDNIMIEDENLLD